MAIVQMGDVRVLVLGEEAVLVRGGGDANDLIGLAWSDEAQMVAVPVAALAPDFFALRSGIAGEVFQKFQNYQLRLAVVGEIGEAMAQSKALNDFVGETNRIGNHLFVPDLAALAARLGG